MFILIPAVIIFLLLSYLYLNDIDTTEQIVVYVLITLVIVVFFKIYTKIQKDLKQQQINSIQLEINQLYHKLNSTKEVKQKELISNKIQLLKKQIENLKPNT